MSSDPRPRAARQSVLGLTTKAIVNVGTLVTVVVALVTDVLAPLGSFALYAAAIPALVLLVVSLPPKIALPVHTHGKRLLPTYWRKPLLLTLGVSTFLLVTAQFVTDSAPAGGWLASQVPAAARLQDELGVVGARTEEIAKTTKSIKKDTEAIKKDTESIKSTLKQVKKETSDDPRKELANIGVVWSTQSFVDAMQSSDARVVRLFLEGGMSPGVLHNGAAAVLYILQPKLPDPVPMLQLIVEAGFDLNADLFDGRVMGHYSDLLPPFFESPDLPEGYIGHGMFNGPALLWLSIRSSYGITAEWDVGVIEFLRHRGADTKVTRQYLEAMESAMGDTPVYQTVRAAVD